MPKDIEYEIDYNRFLVKDEMKHFNEVKKMNNEKSNKLFIDKHNLKINTLLSNFNSRLSFSSIALVSVYAVSFILSMLNIVSLPVFIFLLSSTAISSNIYISYVIKENKKRLLKDYGISNEEEIQNKMLDAELNIESLKKRNNFIEKYIMNKIYDISINKKKKEINSNPESNIVNVRTSRDIKKSIFEIESKIESIYRMIDKENSEKYLINEFNNYTDYKIDGSCLSLLATSTVTIFALYLLLTLTPIASLSIAGYVASSSLLSGVILGALKHKFMKKRKNEILKRMEEFNIRVYKDHVLNLEKYLFYNLDLNELSDEIISLEKELIEEKNNLKIEEEKERESIKRRNNLNQSSFLENINEKQLKLKM